MDTPKWMDIYNGKKNIKKKPTKWMIWGETPTIFGSTPICLAMGDFLNTKRFEFFEKIVRPKSKR